MSRKQRKSLIRIIAALILFICASVLSAVNVRYVGAVLYIVSYIIVGYDIIIKAVRGIARGQVFDENFLMTIASIGANLVGEFAEASAVMIFYQIGELFNSAAVAKSRKSVSALMNIRPDYANIYTDEGEKRVSPDEVAVGDIIIIKPGERIPLDGVVVYGASSVDTSSISGESLPKDVYEGEEVISGCVNINGLIHVRVTKEFRLSTVSKLLDMVQNASSKKAKSENFITRFAKWYTPFVVLCAAFIAFIMPLIIKDVAFFEWIHRALVFLVVSCPCALVISVPLGFFGGIGGGASEGILIKGSNYIETMANVKTIVFDKTGTLTEGKFEVVEIESENCADDELIQLAAYAQCNSSHPIALSLLNAYGKEIDKSAVHDYEVIGGMGVKAETEWGSVYCGNRRLMEKIGISIKENDERTIVYTALDGIYKGKIVIEDKVKDGIENSIKELGRCGVKSTVMLTGDGKYSAKKVCDTAGVDKFYSSLLPADKVEKIEEIINMNEGKVAYVGDGINDAPVIARCDVGIAMGAMGSDAALEASDIVIMNDDIAKIPLAIKICKKTIRIVRENIVFALGVKAAVLILGAFGLSNMWEAVFADVGVSVIAILNSMRGLRRSFR